MIVATTKSFLVSSVPLTFSEVEQWPARWAHNPKVGGSNPPLATKLNKMITKGAILTLLFVILLCATIYKLFNSGEK